MISLIKTGNDLVKMVQSMKWQEELALINDPDALDEMALKRKVSVCTETVFTYPLFKTGDINAQPMRLNGWRNYLRKELIE
ncbi:hypothetical protein [uncultured Microbulbifer sp.]|uniref:hypothetical protein n=1 Tax=uncultured Microbulbifer sp. TaxID=348147 RepID=UPI00262397E3|nr:hypothetical protein [uncultured Microbulbifer sp.]